MITRSQLRCFIADEMNIHPDECDDDGTAIEIAEIGLHRGSFETDFMIHAYDIGIEFDPDTLQYRHDEMDDSGLEILIVRVPYTSAPQ